MSFECFYCSKRFSTKQRVKDHIINQVCRKRIYECRNCRKSCTSSMALRLHNYKKHSISLQRLRFRRHEKLETISLTFSNVHEFLEWKETTEEETTTKFVKPRGTRILRSGNKKTLYVCHRSGKVRVLTDDRKRRPPKKGSCKINAFCPAFILIEEKVNGTIKGEYHANHSNHENEIQHLPLNKAIKTKIADDLKKGATFEEILDEIQRNLNHNECNNRKRIHNLTRKDLHNIMQEHKIAFKERLANDITNIHFLIQECEKRFGKDNPIKFFKLPNANSCSEQDLILVIMTPTQKQMLRQLDRAQICVNGTYGLKGFDLHLTTVSVLDNSGLNLPLTFCISHTVNENIMSIFFSTILTECQKISASVFISEDFPMYINSWCKVIDVPEKWQIVKNLKQNLQKLDGSVKPKSLVDIRLRNIMKEVNNQVFIPFLEKLVTNLLENDSTKLFAQFFEKEFSCSHSKCLYDYKRHTEIHTNVKLEVMFRVLKDIYFKGLKVRRLDFTIFRLMKMCWDGLFRKLAHTRQENDIYALKIINDRHIAALSIPTDRITKKDNLYEIDSDRDGNQIFFVSVENIPCSCQLKCAGCDVCHHMYSCTCVDYHIMKNFCKHIHAVGLFEKECSNITLYGSNHVQKQIQHEFINSVESDDLFSICKSNNGVKQELIDTLIHTIHLLQTNIYKSEDYEKGAMLFKKAFNIFYKNESLQLDSSESSDDQSKTPNLFLSSIEDFSATEVFDNESFSNHEINDASQMIDDIEEIVYVDVYTSDEPC